MSALEGWREEKQAAYLYHVVASTEAGTSRQALFLELAGEAEKQAAIWGKIATEAGLTLPVYTADVRTRLVAALVRKWGARALRSVLSAMKVRGMSIYTQPALGHVSSKPGSELAYRHKGVAHGSNLRAAVFGVNDGLISNASLILGVAGANANQHWIILSAAAGLMAGAFSMAAGEYISVRSQREMFEYQIGLEKEELDQYPEAEAEELALIYQARGINREDAQHMASTLMAHPARALDTLAREELGINPDDLASPMAAAGYSFFSFAIGAAIPLLPFCVGLSPHSLTYSLTLTGIGLFAVGAVLSLFTGRHALWSGLRMWAIGVLAGAVSFGVGQFLGVVVQ